MNGMYQNPFPYASIAMVKREDLNPIREKIEDHIQQVYGDINDMTQDMRDDVERVIELEVTKSNLTHKEEVLEQLKQYYLV